MMPPYLTHVGDVSLVEGYRAGDETVFTRLLDKHLGSVYALFFSS